MEAFIALLPQIFELCVIPLLGILTTYLISFINSKRAELATKTRNELTAKYMNMLGDTITTCVIATNQTYVDSLKSQGAFDMNAQKQALQMTLNSVIAILSDEAKTYLKELYGDLNQYITQRIEAEVRITK